MFFLLSKILLYFIFPLTWIVLSFLIFLIAKSQTVKKRWLVITIVLFILFSNNALFSYYARWWDVAPVNLPAGAQYSCGILLGGFASIDAKDSGYFNASTDRLVQAIQLYKQGKITHILITGGSGSLTNTHFSEAPWAARQLINMGVPASAILIEGKSKNTIENAEFTKVILDSVKSLRPPYVLITSASHMRRAKMIFDHCHISTVVYPCNYFAGRSKIGWINILPTGETLGYWNYYVKELIGYGACYIKTAKM